MKKRRPIVLTNAETDARIRRSKEAILAATYQLLTETGLGGVSVDAVSRRSGVAKTTIYRHWPTRSALLIEACSKLGLRREVPDTGNLRDDVTALVTELAMRLPTARWAAVLPSIIDAAERDPTLAEIHAKLHAELMTALRSVVERALQRGELAHNRDPSTVVAALVGPLFYRRWFSREQLDEKFVKNIIEIALGASATKPANKPRRAVR